MREAWKLQTPSFLWLLAVALSNPPSAKMIAPIATEMHSFLVYRSYPLRVVILSALYGLYYRLERTVHYDGLSAASMLS